MDSDFRCLTSIHVLALGLVRQIFLAFDSVFFLSALRLSAVGNGDKSFERKPFFVRLNDGEIISTRFFTT